MTEIFGATLALAAIYEQIVRDYNYNYGYDYDYDYTWHQPYQCAGCVEKVQRQFRDWMVTHMDIPTYRRWIDQTGGR
jgi:hypothetical protein